MPLPGEEGRGVKAVVADWPGGASRGCQTGLIADSNHAAAYPMLCNGKQIKVTGGNRFPWLVLRARLILAAPNAQCCKTVASGLAWLILLGPARWPCLALVVYWFQVLSKTSHTGH